MTWQPIETAPKDGTPVFVWDGKTPRIADWDNGRVGCYEAGWWCVRGGGLLTPTHWMPLPAAPTEAPEPALAQVPPKDHARALADAVREDDAGRPVADLLRQAADYLLQLGGGPMELCLRGTADAIEAALADYEREASGSGAGGEEKA